MMVVCAKLGMNFVACAPETNWPEAELVEDVPCASPLSMVPPSS